MSETFICATISSRPLANFHSTVWGYRFLPYTLELTEISNLEKLELEELNEKVKKMLVDTPGDCPEKLVLIDTIQRLGVAYHFNNEIETSIQNIFNVSQQDSEIDDDNLYVVALRFRLLRQQGHYISSDVFKQFTNKDGKFKESLANDVKGLLSLYEAAHLRVRDEEILEEALTFTTAHLESMDVPNLSNSLKVQVSEALRQPIRKTLTRLGARKYISIYENIEGHNDLILKFAKLDFNALQKLHQRELSELTRWWKDLDFANKLPYARDRLVECYFWIVGVYFEPKYSRARRMLTKVINMTSITDDTFDAYATFKELVPFTDAIQRWDISVIDSLEPYMRHVYQALLDVYNEMEAELAKECKSDRVYYAKHEMKKLVRAYFKEAEWLNAGETPNCAEYMKNALVSCAYMMLATTSLVGMEESITRETFEWIINEPLIVRASSLISRLMDDIIGHEVEQERGHVASIIECYMKEDGISKQEVQIEFQKQVRNAWKDINKEFLGATEAPMFVLERVLNLARVMDTIYKEADGYTNSKGKVKDMINLLFVQSVKV